MGKETIKNTAPRAECGDASLNPHPYPHPHPHNGEVEAGSSVRVPGQPGLRNKVPLSQN